jgi:hypothetical protein
MTTVTITIPAGFNLNFSFSPIVPEEPYVQPENDVRIEENDDLITQSELSSEPNFENEQPNNVNNFNVPNLWPNAQPGSFFYKISAIINKGYSESRQFELEECELLLQLKQLNSGTFRQVISLLGLRRNQHRNLTNRLWRMTHPEAVRRYRNRYRV